MAKILVVDDNEMHRDLLSNRLESEGHRVVVCADGAEGVRLARDEKPDLILMDMNLPVLDGWEATRAIKSNAETVSIPVIAITARAMADDRAEAIEAGCDDYQTKPVDLPRLLSVIERFLAGEGGHPR